MALSIKEHVLRFQISVNYSSLMQIAKSLDQLSGIHDSPIFIKSMILPQVGEQLATVKKIDN